jgi:hypothetical protein
MLSRDARARLALLEPHQLAVLLVVLVPHWLDRLRREVAAELGATVYDEILTLSSAELLAALDELHGGDVLALLAAHTGEPVERLRSWLGSPLH